MPDLINRLDDILPREYRVLPIAIKHFEELGDGAILYVHRFLAVAEYVKTNDADIFRSHMVKVVEYQIKLFDRFIKDPNSVSDSFVDVSSFDNIFDALAAGSIEGAKELIKYIFAVNEKELQKGQDFPEYITKIAGILLLDHKEDSAIFDKMHDRFQKKYKSVQAYAYALKAIYLKNEELFNGAFKEVLKGHAFLCRTGQEFGDSEDEIIAIWPLGLLNLARYKGLNVTSDSPYIPQDLIYNNV